MKKLNKLNKEKVFGHYLMLDIYDCDPKTVGNIKKCYLYLDGLTEILKLKKLAPPFIVYTDEKNYPDKAGLSGWIPFINEDNKSFSGASIHTLTPTNFISIDVYSCKDFDHKKIKDFTSKIFKPKKIEEQYIARGKGYLSSK